MVRKKYKNESLMKFLTVIGSLLAIAAAISLFLSLAGLGYGLDYLNLTGNAIVAGIVLLVVGIITLYTVIDPNKLLPFTWLVLFIMAIIMFLVGGFWGALCVVLAALIGLIEDL